MQVQVTELAAQKLQEAARQQGKAGYGLRVDVYPGGCAGFMYELSFQKEPTNGELTVETGGVRIYLDPANEPILDGITIDYVDSLVGGGFNIKNPNATSSCGCGKSFG